MEGLEVYLQNKAIESFAETPQFVLSKGLCTIANFLFK